MNILQKKKEKSTQSTRYEHVSVHMHVCAVGGCGRVYMCLCLHAHVRIWCACVSVYVCVHVCTHTWDPVSLLLS